MGTEESELGDSRLLVEDDLACIECGAICNYYPMVIHGFDRCPECHVEHERKRVRSAFGTTSTIEAMLAFDKPEYDTENREIVTDGGEVQESGTRRIADEADEMAHKTEQIAGRLENETAVEKAERAASLLRGLADHDRHKNGATPTDKLAELVSED